jgi:hypothetical protein
MMVGERTRIAVTSRVRQRLVGELTPNYLTLCRRLMAARDHVVVLAAGGSAADAALQRHGHVGWIRADRLMRWPGWLGPHRPAGRPGSRRWHRAASAAILAALRGHRLPAVRLARSSAVACLPRRVMKSPLAWARRPGPTAGSLALLRPRRAQVRQPRQQPGTAARGPALDRSLRHAEDCAAPAIE